MKNTMKAIILITLLILSSSICISQKIIIKDNSLQVDREMHFREPARSDQDILAYWHFDENQGNVVSDSSGNGNNGTIHNMNENDWVSGVSGKALDFDGVDDYISMSNDVWSEEITLETWIKPRDFGNPQTGQRGGFIIFKALVIIVNFVNGCCRIR